MNRQTIVATMVLLASLFVSMSCGSRCIEMKSTLSKEEVAEEDAARVNEFVARRKAIMADATNKDYTSIEIERFQFSVTAYEQAIQIQLRIIELAASSDLYDAHIEDITAARCLLEDILRAKLLKKEDITLSDKQGKSIADRYALFKQIFEDEGQPSKYSLKEYYENGIKLKSQADGEKAEGTSDDTIKHEKEGETKEAKQKPKPDEEEKSDDESGMDGLF